MGTPGWKIEWDDAYKLLSETLGIDYRQTSQRNLQRLEEEISQSSCTKLAEFEAQIRRYFETADLVLARGSRNWEAIEKYGRMLSDFGLEKEGIVKTSSTQRADRETWGNHDFVFFFFGDRSHLGSTTLAKKYGEIKFFDPAPLYERGWIALGDWMEFYNAEAIAVSTYSAIGRLATAFTRPQVTDKVQRARNTRKHYRFNDRETTMQPRRAVDELFFGPDIKKALACLLILFLRSFCPAPLLLKRMGEQPVASLLNTYLPMIEAKLPYAVAMSGLIGQADATGPSPAGALSAMLSSGTGSG